MNIENIKKYLKKNLSNFRYEHSIKVAEEAKKIAKMYNLDENKAYIAGLLHDISKDFSNKKSKEYIKKYNLPIKLLNYKYKDIIHADIGSIMAYELYKCDNEICEAIKYHTIGNISMTDFDKIIFLADKISRNNLSSPLLNVKELIYEGKLNKALLLYLKYQKAKFDKEGKKLHANTLNLLDFLENQNN